MHAASSLRTGQTRQSLCGPYSVSHCRGSATPSAVFINRSSLCRISTDHAHAHQTAQLCSQTQQWQGRPSSWMGLSFAKYTQQDLGKGNARTVKRARLVWTPQLHKRFEEAVEKLGYDKAVPKTIMQEMNIEGLTRENVASHLQKYQLGLHELYRIKKGSQIQTKWLKKIKVEVKVYAGNNPAGIKERPGTSKLTSESPTKGSLLNCTDQQKVH